MKSFLIASLLLLLWMLVFTLAMQGQDAISQTVEVYTQDGVVTNHPEELKKQPPQKPSVASIADFFAKYADEKEVPEYADPTPIPSLRDRDLPGWIPPEKAALTATAVTQTPTPTPIPTPKSTPTPKGDIVIKKAHKIVIEPVRLFPTPTPTPDEPSRRDKPLGLAH